MRRIAATLAFFCALAVSADAQDVTASLSTYIPFGFEDLDGDLPSTLELRVTIPISERFALEPFLTAGSRRTSRGTSPEGFGGVLIRQRLARFTGTNAYGFVTYGAAVYHYGFRFFPRGIDGFETYPAIFGQGGVGLHRRLWDHVAFRPEVQLLTFAVIPIGARFLAGFSVH